MDSKMDKHYEAVKEILEDQIKKITKKGDISPQELENLYKASAIVLDFETREAMKKAEEHGHAYGMEPHNNGQSNHYPWFMYRNGISNNGNSYGPVWNQDMERRSMKEVQNSNDMDNRMSRDNSYTNAYEGAYDGAYDGSYDGSYDASNDYFERRGRDARTGRYVSRDTRGYSRAMDKQRMIGKLEDMMDDAPSEKERRALQQCVDKLEKQ